VDRIEPPMADTQLRIRDDAAPASAVGHHMRRHELRSREPADRARGVEARVRIARALAMLLFMLIVFFAGLVVGTSFFTDPSRLPATTPAAPSGAAATEPPAAAALASSSAPSEQAAATVTPARPSEGPPATDPPRVPAVPPAAAEDDKSAAPAGEPNRSAAVGGSTPIAPDAPKGDAPAAPIAAASSVPRLTKAEIDALVARGNSFLATNDVTTARLFYHRAADAGDGTAALRLGESYDPAFLARARLRPVAADPNKAQEWYRNARERGIAEAAILLKNTTPSKK
jgi:hypothetical protein